MEIGHEGLEVFFEGEVVLGHEQEWVVVGGLAAASPAAAAAGKVEDLRARRRRGSWVPFGSS